MLTPPPNFDEPPERITPGVGALILLWYVCSLVGNMTSKMILQRFAYPVTVTMGPMVAGAISVPLIAATLPQRWAAWILTGNAEECHRYRWSVAALIRTASEHKVLCLVLGVMSLGAGLAHRVALSHVQVSFAHTVKAIQPLYACFFSYLVLGRGPPSPTAVFALIVVVAGIMLCAFSESSASTSGVVALQVSVALMSLSSVVQKLVMKGLDKAEVFAFITGTAAAINLVLVLVLDVPRMSGAGGGGSAAHLALLFCVNSVSLAMQHFTSLTALQHLTPTTHSLVSCMKRVFIIGLSALIFQNHVAPVNALGAVLAVLGATAYEKESGRRKPVRKHPPSRVVVHPSGRQPPLEPPEVHHTFLQYLGPARREVLHV